MSKNKIKEKLESEYYIKHHEMQKLEKKSFLLKKKKTSKDSEFQNFLLNSKKKRILKHKLSKKSYFSTFYFKYIIFKNPEFLALLLIDLNSNIITHPLETLKIRIQSHNKFNDISFFMKNKVEKKSLFLGIKYNYFITAFQCFIFTFTQKLTRNYAFDINPKKLLFCNFVVTDFLTSPLRYLLENRKIALQMGNSGQNVKNLFFKYKKTFLPFFLRDFSFRFSFYLLNFDFVKNLENGSINFGNFIFGTFLASFVAAPFDIVATKIATQQVLKYEGIRHCFKCVWREETPTKFLSGFSFKFMGILVKGSFNLLFYLSLLKFTKDSFNIDSVLD